MSRDKVYGALIFLIAVIIILWYTWWTLYFGVWIGTQVDNGATAMQLLLALSGNPSAAIGTHALMLMQYWSAGLLTWIPVPPRFLSVAIPIWLAVTLILVIAAWIGYTMMTTPPPVPLEELEKAEEEEEEEEEKTKTKKK
ncbi:MAG: hypothetical protein ACUVXA_05115 [Candidatus Jordarchaeum sp.]|uniref:hypothetical protein n=1 Tax=Candidatus Jordarchaeum sp. TaxID=2823881 RepID=UPI00404B091D